MGLIGQLLRAIRKTMLVGLCKRGFLQEINGTTNNNDADVNARDVT